MFRHPRDSSPLPEASGLARILLPFRVFAWGPLAMSYLGVPIVVGLYTIVVSDADYKASIQKLLDYGFKRTAPNRAPAAEVLADFPDPESVVREINAEYIRLDNSTATFQYPDHYTDRAQPLNLLPNSFAHLPEPIIGDLESGQYNVYNNLFYPLEGALMESFVRVVLDDEVEGPITQWGDTVGSWIAMMCGYLEVDNDILDGCSEKNARTWFSINFGREREAQSGPMDRRISKRLGSGKEMTIDMRGKPLGPE
ncbi:MAG: hypothetical protein M1819_005517 [Sarea resinae]|nr:MAG: hypothetical protein M1819_005517 [Sarea resinae]